MHLHCRCGHRINPGCVPGAAGHLLSFEDLDRAAGECQRILAGYLQEPDLRVHPEYEYAQSPAEALFDALQDVVFDQVTELARRTITCPHCGRFWIEEPPGSLSFTPHLPEPD